MKWKKGDTLIEVALAIGIFSLVAIIVVSVVTASLTSAQSSLELTLTREELDSQAEALRFIHEAYISGSQSKDSSENVYTNLWNRIVSRVGLDYGTSTANKYVPYTPAVCSSLYTSNGINTSNAGPRPFIINTHQLASGDPNKIILNGDGNNKFQPATTYPRILFGNVNSNVTLEQEASNYANNALDVTRVEGIYIIAVAGKDKIVSGGGAVSDKPAYYDFYIRSCWMPLNADRASTISTVVRLYNPAAITY